MMLPVLLDFVAIVAIVSGEVAGYVANVAAVVPHCQFLAGKLTTHHSDPCKLSGQAVQGGVECAASVF